MSDYPVYLPLDARRLFQSESLLRRLAQVSGWDANSRLLELHGSLGGLALARALGCQFTIVEPDEESLEMLRERAKAAGMASAVRFVHSSVEKMSFPNASFDGIFSLGRVAGAIDTLAVQLRPLLAEKGRLALTTICRVGLKSAPDSVAAWEKRLGHELLLPRETLMLLERLGYDSEFVESLGDTELDDYYTELDVKVSKVKEGTPGAAGLKAEIELHRAQLGKSGITIALAVTRRKEPNEKPPSSRGGA